MTMDSFTAFFAVTTTLHGPIRIFAHVVIKRNLFVWFNFLHADNFEFVLDAAVRRTGMVCVGSNTLGDAVFILGKLDGVISDMGWGKVWYV